MKRYERIVICIDQPERDRRILDYAAAVVRLAESKEVHLLHASEKPSPGSDEATAGAEVATPEALMHLAEDHFDETVLSSCRYQVLQGAPLIQILRFAYEKEVDLIIIGRHYGQTDAAADDAVLPTRITRKATCPVLVLPEECEAKASTILVPVRDSDCSANALEAACGIASRTTARVVAFNFYQVHGGYTRAGLTREEQLEQLEDIAKRECERLIQCIDTWSVNVQIRCTPHFHSAVVPVVLDAIRSTSADLVVIGARGRTGAAGVLLGAVTEQLIHKSPVPVLAVKKKGECIGILRAWLTLAGEG
ncbi:MAG: universal stress protein [Phycisphaerae bacterium]|jgi:nucleotide-binding universal stress UspA family protein